MIGFLFYLGRGRKLCNVYVSALSSSAQARTLGPILEE